MSAYDTVVLGTLILPEGVVGDGWLAIRGSRIAALGEGEPPAAAERLDRRGSWILPGVIDGQTHAGSCKGFPGIEDTTRSAVAGGVTTIVDMPYDNPAPISSAAMLVQKREAIARYAHANVACYATVLPGQDMSEVAGLIAGGACAFKISSFESSPTRFPRIDAGQMLDLFEALAGTDLPLGLHNEDQEIVLARMDRARAAGENGIAAHATSRPEAAELAATAQFLELGATTGAHAHPVHLTTGRGFDLVARYAAEGFRATGELCVHYLWFDPEADTELGPRMKVNPPIRAGQTEALWAALAAGQVAFVSSDHSSWPIDNKFTESIFDAGAGVPGLETLLPAFFTGAEARGLDAPQLCAAYLAERPAKFFGLWPQKGAIRVGADADLAIWTPGTHVWDESRAHDGLAWSPFHGRSFSGRVSASFVNGRLAWDGEEIRNAPGDGRFAPRGDSRWSFGA